MEQTTIVYRCNNTTLIHFTSYSKHEIHWFLFEYLFLTWCEFTENKCLDETTTQRATNQLMDSFLSSISLSLFSKKNAYCVCVSYNKVIILFWSLQINWMFNSNFLDSTILGNQGLDNRPIEAIMCILIREPLYLLQHCTEYFKVCTNTNRTSNLGIGLLLVCPQHWAILGPIQSDKGEVRGKNW